MPPEIAALVDKPHLLILGVLLGALLGISLEQFRGELRRRNWRQKKWRQKAWRESRPNKGRGTSRPGPWQAYDDQPRPKQPDAADQLRIVMSADFTIQPLLNRSEARVFKELDRAVIACNPTWQVMAQASLGEILQCKDAAAYSCINSKRVDLLLVDGDCRPRHAIEYQGGAHHQGSAAARDAVKKEALRRAGIGYHEVVAGQTTPAELRRLVEKLVTKPA